MERPYASSHVPPSKKRITLDIDPALHEDILDAVVYAQDQGEAVSKVSLIERGMQLAIAELAGRLEVDAFPHRDHDPRPGRRPSAG